MSVLLEEISFGCSQWSVGGRRQGGDRDTEWFEIASNASGDGQTHYGGRVSAGLGAHGLGRRIAVVGI